jgi:mannose-6-phosphate isomerase-like protein (cupin superfamily)
MKIVSLAELQDQQLSHNPKIKKRVMISLGELGKLTNFSRAVFPVGEIADAHRHETMGEVFFVQSGEGEIRIDGESFKLLPGVCALVEPHEEHELRNTGDEELVITYFGIGID